MKHVELQKALDKRKFLESEKEKKDKSGFMEYCGFCNFRKSITVNVGDTGYVTQKTIGCCKDQEHRENYKLCAKAYNQMCKYHTALNKVYD